MTHLLVFAHRAEAQAFADVPHMVTGVGKAATAALFGRRLAAAVSDPGARVRVTVLGTAGLVDDDLDIETVYRVSSAVQHDFALGSPRLRLSRDGVVETEGAYLGALPSDGRAVPTYAHELHGVPEVGIATGDVFVSSNAERTRILGLGAGLVDMESYVFAAICAEFGVPVQILKIASDAADDDTSQTTWDEIVARKSAQLRVFAERHGLL